MTPFRALLATVLLAVFLADVALLVLGITLAPFFIVLWPLYLAVVQGMVASLLALRWGPWSTRPRKAPAPAAHLQAALTFSLIVVGFIFFVAAITTHDLDWRISAGCALNCVALALTWFWRPWA
jgi:hypothetical protein